MRTNQSQPPQPLLAPSARIMHLELISSAPLVAMQLFYQHKLGLSIVEQQPDRLTIKLGQTQLTFVRSDSAERAPFYHFAINIPENKILAARQWQMEHTAFIPIPVALRDPDYPSGIVDYRHWNAHAIFFTDPAGNIIEYIARHELPNSAPGPFTSRDLLYVSEIALVADDVLAVAAQLKLITGLQEYRGSSAEFVALGDPHGLLLVMKRGRVISFAAADAKAVSVFPTKVIIRGSKPSSYSFAKYPYTIDLIE